MNNTLVTPAQSETIQNFLQLMYAEDCVFEVRAPKAVEKVGSKYTATISGYYTYQAIEQAAREIAYADEKGIAPGWYITLNPVQNDLLARSANRLKFRAAETTTDNQVRCRRWLLVDVDPVRPSGVSATDGELTLANKLAEYIATDLAAVYNWPQPIIAMSGNGYHLLYRIDLPAEDENLAKDVLTILAGKYDTEYVTIDKGVYNPARITKIIGTVSRKGDSLVGIAGVEDRPHRRSEFINIPDTINIVSRDMLELLRPPRPIQPEHTETQPPQPQNYTKPLIAYHFEKQTDDKFDCSPAGVKSWLLNHGVEIKGENANGSKTMFYLARCPINPAIESTGGTDIAVIVDHADGKLGYANLHNRGAAYQWSDLRKALDPEYAASPIVQCETYGVDLSNFKLQSPRKTTNAKNTMLTDVEIASELQSVDNPKDPGPFPEKLLSVPGFIGDIIKHNVDHAIKPQPVLALGAALALLGTITGRKVRDEYDTRTNVYCLGICETGGGKERARQVNKNILFQAGLDDLAGPEGLASHAGLISAVEKQPAILLQLDEIGRLLKTVGQPGRSPHLYHIATVLMKLFTSSSGVYLGDAYADTKKNKSIDQPNACLYGTTVPKSFYESLTAESLTDGFLARMLIFESNNHDPEINNDAKPATPLPETIIEVARWWGEFRPGGNLSKEHPVPKVVPIPDEVNQLFIDFEKGNRGERQNASEAVAAMWTRTTEKARKLALLYACSLNHEDPVITAEGVQWAMELSSYITRKMISTAEHWVSESPFEARQKKIVRIIRDVGGSIVRRDLSRRTQSLTHRERQEVIDNLIEVGILKAHVMPTTKRQKVTYILQNTESLLNDE